VMPVFLALLIGGFLGVAAGYAGGLVNSAIMRLTDVLYAFPSILLAIAITGILGSGLQNTILALTISFIPPVIRISESVTTQVRHLDFVEAARASGAGPLTIMRYHILNNVLGPILVYATSLISICIILAAGLSFLGLGVTPPSAEWGLMLNNLRQALWVSPLVAALPGVMIFITSMCFNLMSDGLRQAMDVRL
jgi:peptide/nickel transport system permease protein